MNKSFVCTESDHAEKYAKITNDRSPVKEKENIILDYVYTTQESPAAGI